MEADDASLVNIEPCEHWALGGEEEMDSSDAQQQLLDEEFALFDSGDDRDVAICDRWGKSQSQKSHVNLTMPNGSQELGGLSRSQVSSEMLVRAGWAEEGDCPWKLRRPREQLEQASMCSRQCS